MVSFKLGSLEELEAYDSGDDGAGVGLTPAPGGRVAQSDGAGAGAGSRGREGGAGAGDADGGGDESGEDSADSMFEVDAKAGIHNAALAYMTPRGPPGDEAAGGPMGDSFMDAGGGAPPAVQLDSLDDRDAV